MILILAIVIHAVALSMDFSQSFASLRQRPSHADTSKNSLILAFGT
jgi:ABC-type Fe3+ transport system permease subunit